MLVCVMVLRFLVVMMMAVPVIVRMTFLVLTIVLLFKMHVELRPGDVRTLLPRDVEMVFIKAELRELALELFEVHTEIEQRADEHVAADAAEDVEIERVHNKSEV